jgi:hypothetical protein
MSPHSLALRGSAMSPALGFPALRFHLLPSHGTRQATGPNFIPRERLVVSVERRNHERRARLRVVLERLGRRSRAECALRRHSRALRHGRSQRRRRSGAARTGTPNRARRAGRRAHTDASPPVSAALSCCTDCRLERRSLCENRLQVYGYAIVEAAQCRRGGQAAPPPPALRLPQDQRRRAAGGSAWRRS